MTAGMADRPAEEEPLGEFLDAGSSAPSALFKLGIRSRAELGRHVNTIRR